MILGFGKFSPSVMRALRPDKAEQCASIHAASFAHPWSSAELAALIASSNTIGVAALDPSSGKLRGFVLSRLAADEAEILTIAVQSAFRKRGVGRALLTDHLSQLAAMRIRTLFLEVDMENVAAIRLYARFGFREVGQRPGYYRKRDGKNAVALVLRRDFG